MFFNNICGIGNNNFYYNANVLKILAIGSGTSYCGFKIMS